MNGNEQIIYCKEIIRNTLATKPPTQCPAFITEPELLESFITAVEEMSDEILAQKCIPLVFLDSDSTPIQQLMDGATLSFLVSTLLAETLAKIGRKDPKKVLAQFVQSAAEMRTTMSQKELAEYLKKYDLEGLQQL